MSRGLRTPPLPGTHASVGDCWQNSKCCHLLIRRATQFPRHPCVAPDPLQNGLGFLPHPSAAVSSATFTVRFPLRADNGVNSFIFWIIQDLGRACRPVVHHPRRENVELLVPDHIPFWSKPDSIFGLSLFTTFISTLSELTLSRLLAPDRRDAGSRRLGSRVAGRSLGIEATLSPRLRTPLLPVSPAGVADRWRNIGSWRRLSSTSRMTGPEDTTTRTFIPSIR